MEMNDAIAASDSAEPQEPEGLDQEAFDLGAANSLRKWLPLESK
jgi:hypothetical protein